MNEIFLILHDIRSIHNVASIFRTADGAGVSKIFLTGYTPGPVDRFGRKVAAFTKVSLGAEDTVPWEKKENPLTLIQDLKTTGVRVVALEQHPHSQPYDTVASSTPTALIVGNEVDGVSKAILAMVDVVMEIPMRGTKESLNVSVAAGVALYALTENLT